MLFDPGEESWCLRRRHHEGDVKHPRKINNQREKIRWIDTGKARTPKAGCPELTPRISVNKDESREHEEKPNANISNRRQLAVPSRSGSDVHSEKVKNYHVYRGKEA